MFSAGLVLDFCDDLISQIRKEMAGHIDAPERLALRLPR